MTLIKPSRPRAGLGFSAALTREQMTTGKIAAGRANHREGGQAPALRWRVRWLCP
jgi:hypothetical protein